MSQHSEADEDGRCVRCGTEGGPHVLCVRCDAAHHEGEGTVLRAVRAEMQRQEQQWGVQQHTDLYWLGIALEELGEVAQAVIEGRAEGAVWTEVVQTAAVLASWLECMEGRVQGARSRERGA